MNISEGNKLIADFMNLARDDTDEEFGPGYIVNDYKISDRFIVKTDVQYCSPEELPYHLSWDWLIPVVEKIASEDLSSIKATWLVVVEYIKWYNENYSA